MNKNLKANIHKQNIHSEQKTQREVYEWNVCKIKKIKNKTNKIFNCHIQLTNIQEVET